MKKITILLISLSALGCTSANMIKAPNSSNIPQEYAPVNSPKDNFGVVNYLDEGASSVREARRKDAFKKMYNSCNGKYRILEETNGETSPMYTMQGNFIYSLTSTYVTFVFECVE